MLTSEIQIQVDRISHAFYSNGIANPLQKIYQIIHLPFIRRLDDWHTLDEIKANRQEKPMEERDMESDIYEYMRAPIAPAGQNTQLRTSCHIVQA